MPASLAELELVVQIPAVIRVIPALILAHRGCSNAWASAGSARQIRVAHRIPAVIRAAARSAVGCSAHCVLAAHLIPVATRVTRAAIRVIPDAARDAVVMNRPARRLRKPLPPRPRKLKRRSCHEVDRRSSEQILVERLLSVADTTSQIPHPPTTPIRSILISRTSPVRRSPVFCCAS